jgi:FlaA1/EpsC-like NDP-sugar epimerase
MLSEGIMKSTSEKRKFLTAIGLSYVMCLLIVWDSAERARSIKILLATWTIALSFDIVLYLARRKYESNRVIRLIFAAVLLISYVIYGLTFRSLIHHVYFAMTMSVFMFVGSFIVDILQSDELGVPKEEDNQEEAPDR